MIEPLSQEWSERIKVLYYLPLVTRLPYLPDIDCIEKKFYSSPILAFIRHFLD